jgi:hypothetical protein
MSTATGDDTPQDEDSQLWDRAAADVAKAPPLTEDQRDTPAAAAEVSRARSA